VLRSPDIVYGHVVEKFGRKSLERLGAATGSRWSAAPPPFTSR
jgi:hypothetical protein